MKKKLLIMCLCTVLLFVGCASNEVPEDNKSQSSVEDSPSVDATVESSQSKENTVMAEIEGVEAKALELQEKISEAFTQMEMNELADEEFEIWDAELNSIWSQLKETLDEKSMNAILDEQRAWIVRKENSQLAFSYEAFGGSMAPLMYSEKGSAMTRKRVYDLGKILAEAKGEDFVISSEVTESFKWVDPTIDEVFSFFEGDHSDYGFEVKKEGSTWKVTAQNGITLTDADITIYSAGIIFFEKDNVIYQLSEGWERDSYMLYYGTDMNELHDIMEAN